MPAATPTPSHHLPLPVTCTCARHQTNAQAVTVEGMSGVAASISADTMMVRLKNSAANAARSWSFRISAAARQTNQVAGSDSTTPAARTPRGVSPSSSVPARISQAIMGG